MGTGEAAPLVAHIVYRFDVGGLENGVVNLINHMPRDRYRHAIIALTECTSFQGRIRGTDVEVLALHKRDGHDWGVHRRLWTALRRLRPAIIHTRNLPTLECVVTGRLAGIGARVHGEHGRDVYDLHGQNRKYNLLRRMIRPLVSHYIAVSEDLAQWLRATVHVPPPRVTQIYNGVESDRFRPRGATRPPILPEGFAPEDAVVFGTVGRMQAVKNQTMLARAFVALCASDEQARRRARLVMVGDGPLRAEAAAILQEAGLAAQAWLPGERADIPACLQALDVFVLPSIGEGISNTILEAMSTALPVIATSVGGNPELVLPGSTGMLVPSSAPAPTTAAMRSYLDDPALIHRHGAAGRKAIEERFSMTAMVNAYLRVYDSVLPSAKGR